MKKPNILFFFTDQQRWDTVGCYNNKLNLTPVLDRLASEGIRFEYAFTCQPVCGPARACLQTGQYATANGCFINGIMLPSDAVTIPKLFRGQGYETAYIGKWHLGETYYDPVPIERRGGWEDYWLASDALEFTASAYGGYMYDRDNNKVSFEHYRIDAVTDYAEGYIRSRESENPYFLFVSYLEPHHQNNLKKCIAPEGYAERYKNAYIPEDLKNGQRTDDWEANIADYYGTVKRLDESLERLIQALKDKGEYENTIIVFTSDHGNHFRTRNGDFKRTCHDASIRIPLVIKGGVFDGGHVINGMASIVDIAPTLCDIAGIKVPESMQGVSLAAAISDGGANLPEEIFAQISESQVARTIRTRRYKLCVTADGKNPLTDKGSDTYRVEYLYDLENDPFELNNLLGKEEYRATAQDLAGRLIKRMVGAGEPEPVITLW